MQQDDMLWHCMKNGFCSFKVQTKTQMLCKNDNNVLGICSKSACPLANSNYATIREHRGVVYLCKKVIERAAFPHKLWEKIPLPKNYEEALAQIDVLLPYWNQKQVHRCKQRYTKIYQYLERAKKLETKMRSKKLITLPRKMERREKAREKKALIAAKLENQIEMEIMNRVKLGVYGERYQFKDKQVFEKALTDRLEVEDEEELEGERIVASTSTGRGKKRAREVEKPIVLSSKYVPDIEDADDVDAMFSDRDGGDDDDDFWASEDEQWARQERETAEHMLNPKKKQKETVVIERER